MIRIVHTADWHVGKSLKGKHRSHEYRSVLQELKEFLQQKSIDFLIIAGDIFDSSAPSAESEEIVYHFFHEVLEIGIQVLVIAGNHDSGLRFEAISHLVKQAGIRMKGLWTATSDEKTAIDVLLTSKENDQVQIFLLPFIPENVFVRADDLVHAEKSPTGIYSKQIGEIFKQLQSKLIPQAAHIAVAHLMMHGARPGGDERRLYLGDNYAVHPNEIPDWLDYLALGHVHLQQQIPGSCPIYYCGSPLQMDFGESQAIKGFLYLEIQPGQKANPQFIELEHAKKLIALTGNWDEIVTLSQHNPEIQDAYLKITVATDASTMGLSLQLKKMFPNAIDIRREYSPQPSASPSAMPSQDWLPKLYQEYHLREYQASASQATMEEFQTLYEKKRK